MMTAVSLEGEILNLLGVHGSLSVAFITRFLNERGFDITRQRVERTLRNLIGGGKVEAFYVNRNRRKHYRLR